MPTNVVTTRNYHARLSFMGIAANCLPDTEHFSHAHSGSRRCHYSPRSYGTNLHSIASKKIIQFTTKDGVVIITRKSPSGARRNYKGINFCEEKGGRGGRDRVRWGGV